MAEKSVKKTVKKAVEPVKKKAAATKKTVTKKVTAVKKEATKKVNTVVKKNKKSKMPGGVIMYVFLIIATLAAITAIAGVCLENTVIESGSNLAEYQEVFDFVANCKSASIGIFAIFIVLTIWTKFTNEK